MPTEVKGINTPGVDIGEAGASLTPDELTIYFTSNRLAPGSPNFDVYVASRSSLDADFGVAQKIDALDLGGDERATWISPDELTIFFNSSGAGDYNIFVATRTSKLVSFGTPQPLGVNTTEIDQDGRTTGDARTLYFHRSAAMDAIFRSTLGANGFTVATAVAELNTGNASSPVPSTDDLTIYFASDRAGTAGSFDILSAHRNSTSLPFNQITNITELNSVRYDEPDWVSADGCHIYFTSLRDGGFAVWMAARPL